MIRIQLKLAAIALAALSFDVTAAPVQWTVAAGGNDNWYEIVTVQTGRVTWDNARADALSRSYLGLGGYLATVTSAAEFAFVDALEGPFQTRGGWLGGSDAAVEGEWRWMDGPEAGTLFWLGDSTGTAIGFASWGSGWPNSEDYLVSGYGSWGSSPGSASNFYYVEYSAAGAPPPNGVPLPGTLSLASLASLVLAATLMTRRRPAYAFAPNPTAGAPA